MKIFVINGPNMNLLGIREKEIYGNRTYEDLLEYIKRNSPDNLDLEFRISNHEGDIVDFIHESYYQKADGIVINPAALSHYSIAVLDALRAVPIKAVEVHLSDISRRESYRRVSITSQGCIKTIAGLGFDSYIKAIEFLINGESIPV